MSVHLPVPLRLLLGLSAALAMGLAVVAPRALAQTPRPSPTTAADSGISVVGQGSASTAPGVARVTLGVDLSDPSLANAQAQASQRMEAVLNSLRAAGIADNNIRTTTFNVAPQYDQPQPGQQPNLRGYQVQNLVEVRTSRIDQLGAILDAALAAGATRVQGIGFEPGDPGAVQAAARELAFQDARTKAEQLARLSGLMLGPIVLIETSDAASPPSIPVPAAAPAPQQATPVESGQLTVRSSVRVVFAIQGA